ncbi:uncharacterized protein A4U43_C03F9850 [Asparagus officinalis]|uniref:Uncharacterized protein n=1 Tax=Asparagus officinalis TaxID=4686 RepID=A0A5P1F8Q3_ASPOF|nr:eukaryotic translation initiation factor 4B [Asparagus officinalis]ONK74758.1 uncharacterized protein A4U43_C03F9850 [Asparagus officinalis]
MGARPVSNEGRSGGVSQMHQQQQGLGLEGGERPKLKLLPRSRPMEGNDTWFLDEKQEHQPTIHPVCVENSRELQGNMNMPRPGSAGADIGDRGSERPRLNLKPRSLPVEQSDDITEKERKSVFGGARPRELVLKERGVDDVVANSQEVISPAHSHRVKSDSQRTDMKSRQEPPALATRRGERSDSSSVDQRSGREFEKKDARSDHEKVDNLRASWRNDNWKNTREIERPAERRPEPETWRKPVEQPKQEVPGTASRHGKAASALELAQAFSRSVSDPRSDNHFPSQRSSTGLGQAPFSRLTDTTRDFYSGANPRHINGY